MIFLLLGFNINIFFIYVTFKKGKTALLKPYKRSLIVYELFKNQNKIRFKSNYYVLTNIFNLFNVAGNGI